MILEKDSHELIPVDFDPEWIELMQRLKQQFGKKPNLETILFLIGINELNTVRTKFTKEEKQDLMHIAVCRLLSYNGYYTYKGKDTDGWPHWEVNTGLPALNISDQESLIKSNILLYFKSL